MNNIVNSYDFFPVIEFVYLISKMKIFTKKLSIFF